MHTKLSQVLEDHKVAKQQLQNQKEKYDELREETWGEGDSDTEDKAEEFFARVGKGVPEDTKKELNELDAKIDEGEQKVEQLKNQALEEIADMKLPLAGRVEKEDGEIFFPFESEIDLDILKDAEEILDYKFRPEDFEIEEKGVSVPEATPEQAMDLVQSWVEDLRSHASTQMKKGEHVEKIRGRDLKIQHILHELYREDQPMAKKDLERSIDGVDTGDLRGVLYSITDTPYIDKKQSKFEITQTGHAVMEKYLRDYGEPEKIEGGDSE
jgi:hypothetical protein